MRGWNGSCDGEMEVEAWGYGEWVSGVSFAFCIMESVRRFLQTQGFWEVLGEVDLCVISKMTGSALSLYGSACISIYKANPMGG